MLCWEAESFIYVEDFCVLTKLSRRGCGACALELLAREGKTVILEIDPPIDEISRRSKIFTSAL